MSHAKRNADEIAINNEYKIYSLSDPRTDEIRYIGFTSKSLDYRLRHHIIHANSHRSNTHVLNWIRELLRENLSPKINLLEIVPIGESWKLRETYWIAEGRRRGWDLTNLTNGGDGRPGCKLSDEAKKHISDGEKRRKNHPEIRRLISEGLKRYYTEHPGITVGRPYNPETARKIGLANKGRIHTEESRRHMSEAQLRIHRKNDLQKRQSKR
jgi:hypothetical protein